MAVGRPIDLSLAAGGSPRSAPGAAITVRSLRKTFDLPHDRYVSAKERVVHPFTFRTSERLEALSDVSLEIAAGETFGIVGHNGSGKSTLLRCLAGIYVPDAGEIAIEGRVAPFIELGVGFNPELAARENAIQSAVLLGLSRKAAAARFDDILAFAELERFADQKLKNYSSGMAARLAFAVAAHVEADVLLCDEVLAVGDAAFREKCYDHFDRMRSAGTTIVLVTHDMDVLERSCSRSLLLERGRVVEIGPTSAVVERYQQLQPPLPGADVECVDGSFESRAPMSVAFPSAAGKQRSRLAAVTVMLAITEVRLKYFDAALSYAWALLRPALLFGVLLVVFGGLTGINEGVAHYPEQLVVGVVLWMFFIQVANASLPSLTRRSDLLRKLPVPRLAIPYSTVLAGGFDLVLNLVVMVVLLLVLGVEPRLAWLELIPLTALLALLATGTGLALSAIYVRYRDLDQLWAVASQALFFLTPIFYVIATVPARYERAVLLANPIAAIVTQARSALIGDGAPSAASVAGGAVYLLVPLAITLAVVAIGAVAFLKISPKAPEYV